MKLFSVKEKESQKEKRNGYTILEEWVKSNRNGNYLKFIVA